LSIIPTQKECKVIFVPLLILQKGSEIIFVALFH